MSNPNAQTSVEGEEIPVGSMRLLDRLVAHALAWPDRIAYRDAAEGTSLTYAALVRRASAVAHRLRSEAAENSVVLICLPNLCDFPVAFLGTLAAGCAAMLVSTESPAMELQSVAASAGAVAVIGTSDVLAAVNRGARISLEDLRREDARPLPAVLRAGGNARLLLLSSGSTGKPKIVYRGGDAVDAVSEQMVNAIGFRSTDCVLATAPLCHSYGIEHGLLAPIWAGCGVSLCRGLDLPLVSRELMSGGITILPGVPSMYEMLGQLAANNSSLPGLRAAYSAGGPLPMAVSQAFTRRYGVVVSQLYGASEIGSVTYGNCHDEHFDPAGVGRAMAGVEVRICDGNDPDSRLAAGEEGQVWVRARSMFGGYLGEGQTPVVDGFFPTGDLGRLDEYGNLIITGRIKLLIDVGGLKVNPIEVEDVLMGHPLVGDCVVIPVRQSETVLRLKAIVIPRMDSHPPMIEELRQFARQRLAAYKVPRVFEVRDSLPRNATGKIMRHLVQA